MAEPMSDFDRAAALSKSIIFCSLEEADRMALAAHAHRRRLSAGESIFHAGDPGDSMMAVVVGEVRISISSAAGKQIILNDIGPGDVFGEIALLDGRGRSADATALTKVELLTIDRRNVIDFLEPRGQVGLRLLEHVCGLLRHSDVRMADIAFFGLGVRLSKLILNRISRSPAGRHRPAISLSQTDLAHMVAGSREAVNKQLARWQRDGIVEMRDGWIFVDKPDALEAILESQRD
jgi:CRP-like cAMP-binding protein